ncbi:hypothetical protein HDU91_004887 [Kappamyces sp. JEL0680]|nr:hypothetical protein HDU91_004887 [Kappamyces sp. JEL0680]
MVGTAAYSRKPSQDLLVRIDDVLSDLPKRHHGDTSLQSSLEKARQEIQKAKEEFKVKSPSSCPRTRNSFTRHSGTVLYIVEEEADGADKPLVARDSGVFTETQPPEAMPQLFCESHQIVFLLPVASESGRERPDFEFTLGRSGLRGSKTTANDLILHHSRVSKRHACLRYSYKTQRWSLSDSSSNGTLINYVGFSHETIEALQDQDIISILPLEVTFHALDKPIPAGWDLVQEFPFALDIKNLAEKDSSHAAACANLAPIPALGRIEMLR